LALGRVARLAFVTGQQRLKVGTPELWTPINDDEFWETVVSMDTLSQNHHGRPIGWFVEGQIHCQDPPRKGVCQEGGPGLSKTMARSRISEFHIKPAVVKMSYLEGTISVAR